MNIEFKRPELEDKGIIKPFYEGQTVRSCEYTFANNLLWSRQYKVSYAIVGKMLVFLAQKDKPSFSFPVGKKEDLKETIEMLREYCREQGFGFQMHSVVEEQFAWLEEAFPGQFEIEYDRDSADYVYEQDKLANLSGKKYHGKRNHINKFMEACPDWSYESLNDENVEECFQMALQWRRESGCDDDPEKNAEMCVTLNSLRLFKELELCGGLLRAGGEVIAFSIGEPVSTDTMVVHIEKAHSEIQGAYPMINKQFVLNEAADYQYINREEDMGLEGLRKAKMSYRPVFLVEKGVVIPKEV